MAVDGKSRTTEKLHVKIWSLRREPWFRNSRGADELGFEVGEVECGVVSRLGNEYPKPILQIANIDSKSYRLSLQGFATHACPVPSRRRMPKPCWPQKQRQRNWQSDLAVSCHSLLLMSVAVATQGRSNFRMKLLSPRLIFSGIRQLSG